MNSRTAAVSTLALAFAKAVGSITVRFMRDQPKDEFEQKAFVHINSLVELVLNRLLHRAVPRAQLTVVK